MKTQNLPQIYVPLITHVSQGKLGKARGNHGLDEIEIIHVQKKVKLYRKRPGGK